MSHLPAPIRRARKLMAIAAGTGATITLVLAAAGAQPGGVLAAAIAYALFAALVIASYVVRTRPGASFKSHLTEPEQDAPGE